jgi:hypothetical protein
VFAGEFIAAGPVSRTRRRIQLLAKSCDGGQGEKSCQPNGSGIRKPGRRDEIAGNEDGKCLRMPVPSPAGE